jgi:hypothetical protein
VVDPEAFERDAQIAIEKEETGSDVCEHFGRMWIVNEVDGRCLRYVCHERFPSF